MKMFRVPLAFPLRALPLLLAAGLAAPHARAAEPAATGSTGAPAETLTETIAHLDEAMFAAFNRCADPAQLERHASFFADDVEFYHDNGGVTWNRRDMLANTQRYACGHYTRTLVTGTLKVFPIKDFGAIAQGVHRFCQVDGACEGEADFTMVWQRTAEGWRVTRALSYGHRSAP